MNYILSKPKGLFKRLYKNPGKDPLNEVMKGIFTHVF